MRVLANCAVLQDSQLHSLFLPLSLRIKLLSVQAPSCSRAQMQVPKSTPLSKRASELVAGESRTLSRNGQKGCNAETHTKKWAFCIMWRDCPLLPCSNCKPVAGPRWSVACEFVRLWLWLLICLYCTQHRAVGTQTMSNSCRSSSTKQVVNGWRELPSPETQRSSKTHLSLHSRHLSRLIVHCLKHCPRVWQEVVLNGRLS